MPHSAPCHASSQSPPLLLFAVKFLREVTPYFRKASIISEVGWELQRAFLCPLGPGAPTSPPAPTPKTTPRADTRYIPLQLTHLARNLKYIDPGKWPAHPPPLPPASHCSLSKFCTHTCIIAENRCLELHSPDGVHSCILRASDSAEALIWFNALHSAMGSSTQRALAEANRALVNLIGELKHIGWLSKRLNGGSAGGGGGGSSGSGGGGAASGGSGTSNSGVAGEVVSVSVYTLLHIPIQHNLIRSFFLQLQPSGRSSSESSDESDKWLPIFVAVTEREFRIYESAPWSVEAWSRPLESYALATTRLAGAGNNSSLNVSIKKYLPYVLTITFSSYSCAGPTDYSVLCALWHSAWRPCLLATLGDASRYGRLGACPCPGLTSGGEFAARILVPLPVPGQAVSIGCAYKSWILLVRLRWLCLVHAHPHCIGGGNGQQHQDAAVAVRIR